MNLPRPKLRSVKEISAMLDNAIDKAEKCGKGTQSRLCQNFAIIALAWTLGLTERKPLVEDTDA